MTSSGMEWLAELEAELKREEDTFYASLGRAIAEWTSVEYSLFRVFIQATDYPDASVRFFDKTSFRRKLQMTDEAMSLRFGKQPVFSAWRKIEGKLDKSAEQRNHLAHSPVAANLRAKEGKKVCLHVHLYNAAKHPSVTGKSRISYYQSRIESVEEGFRELANRVGTFAYRLSKITGKPPFPGAQASA
jgi:hypothetical protein